MRCRSLVPSPVVVSAVSFVEREICSNTACGYIAICECARCSHLRPRLRRADGNTESHRVRLALRSLDGGDSTRDSGGREPAGRVGVSNSTVQRALVRHGIARLPRNRNRRPPSAQVLDDRAWLRERYRHSRRRPSADEVRSAWDAVGTFRGAGRRPGIAHTTAAVWPAEIGVFADTTPALPRSVLLDAIRGQWPISRIAAGHKVSAVTVPVELHRHGLQP
jgi:hypothetical protein